MREQSYKAIIILLLTVISLPVSAQFYYGLHQIYGKNRVQYNEFLWNYYRYERYDVYYYKQSRAIAEKTAVMVERNLKKLESFMNERLESRIQILVFTSLTDLKQSNVNASDDEAYNTGGVTRSAGTKMFVYFDGDFNHLEAQIREGLTHLLLNNMVYGGFSKSVKNSTLLNLPEWYTEGLISYLAHPWTPEMDQKVRDGFSSGQYKRFNSLTGEDAKYAGHSIWHYIAETYGEGVVKNLIYMTIVNRSIDQAFLYVLGSNLEEVTTYWRKYYLEQYQITIDAEDVNGKEIIKSKKGEKVYEVKLSPNGQKLAYITNNLGEFRVFEYDLIKRKKKKILKKGYKIAQNSDYSMPLLAWHPSSKILAMITEEKGFIWLYFINMDKNKIEKKNLFGFEKILHFSYSDDGQELLMSAIKKGRSDIFVYTIRSASTEQITNDDFDDVYPEFLNGGKQIVFSSNRIDDTLRTEQTVYKFKEDNDLFIYTRKKLPKNEDQLLWRITNTPNLNEIRAQEYQPMHISYLSDRNGVQDQYILAIDSFISYIDTVTHYEYSFDQYRITESTRNIQEQDFSAERELVSRLYFIDKRYRIYLDDLIEGRYLTDALSETSEEEKAKINNERKNLVIELDSASEMARTLREKEVDIEDYEFDSRLYPKYSKKPRPKKKQNVITPGNDEVAQKEEEEEEIDFPGGRNYFTSFYRDNFTLQIDFLFDNPQYQPYSGFLDNNLLNPGFNVNFRIGTMELLNDYRLVMGVRTDFQPVPGLSISPNSEIMVGAVNNKRRLDKSLALYRRSQLSTIDDFFFVRFLTYEGHFTLSWPFSEIDRVSATAGYRNQKTIILSDSPISLPIPSQTTDHVILKASYVYDNTRKKGMNLYNGTRFKIFTEYYKNMSKSQTGMHTAGIDFRTYMPVARSIIWANRFASGTSFGQEKLVYFLGGVDNQITAKFNNDIPVDESQNYIFQTLATNMRGFRQNIRNGNSFAVINSELRIPFFKALMNRPIKSDFIANFQIIGFGDIGTAWNGPHPYSDENTFNKKVIGGDNPSLKIILNNQHEPIVGGFGFGLRSRLLGYFCRVDWAWGVQDGVILPNIFYFSLSTDF